MAILQLSSDLSKKIYFGGNFICYLARLPSSLLPPLPFFKPRKAKIEFRQVDAEMQISILEGLIDLQNNTEVTLPYIMYGKNMSTFLRGVGLFALGTSLCFPFFTKGALESKGL